MPFAHFQQAWHRTSLDPAWPCKIMPAEQLLPDFQLPADRPICVQYYGGSDDQRLGFANEAELSPFERDSAATFVPEGAKADEISRAVKEALLDEEIVPITGGADGSHETVEGRREGTPVNPAAARRASRAPPKRRARDGDDAPTREDGPGRGGGRGGDKHHAAARRQDDNVATPAARGVGPEEFDEPSDTALLEYKSELEGARMATDVAAATTVLLKLARSRVTFRQLQSTKIGVAVCDLRLDPNFKSRYHLIQHIAQWWAFQLPEATKKAWSHWRRLGTKERQDLGGSVVVAPPGEDTGLPGGDSLAPPPPWAKLSFDAAAISRQLENSRHSHAAAIGGQEHVSGPGSPSLGHPAPASVGGLATAAMSFSNRLADALLVTSELAAIEKSREDCMHIVHEFASAAKDSEMRAHMLRTFSRPEHVDLRRRILTGDLSADVFLNLSEAELMTPDEAAAAEISTLQKLKEKEEQDLAAMGTPSEMYECPNCDKRKTRYSTAQTRSADEPETVFIYCLECHHRWTLRGD